MDFDDEWCEKYLARKQQYTDSTRKQEQDEKKSYLIVGIVGAVVTCAALLGVFYFLAQFLP